MTLLDLVPFAAVAAALGVGALLVGRGAGIRMAGIGLLLAGSAPLVLTRVAGLLDLAGEHPLLAAIAALAGAGLVAGGAALFLGRPWLIAVLAVLAGLRIPLSFSDPSPTNHLVVLWLVILAGLASFAWRGIKDDWPAPRLGAVGWALAAFVLLVAASLFWSTDPGAGGYTFVAFYAPFGALAAMVGSMEIRGRLPVALGTTQVVLAVIVSLVALYQLKAGHIFWNPDLMEGNVRLTYFRTNSLFWDASALGRFQALAILTIIGTLALGARQRSVLGAAALCGLIFVGLDLSYSRAGLAMLILGILLLAACWRPRVVLPLGAVALIGAVGVLAVTGGVSWERITSSRTAIAEQGFHAFQSAPVIGVGLGGYPSSHSVALGVAAELGVIGLIALLALLAVAVRAAIRPATPGRDRALRAVVAVELAAIFAHSMIDSGLFDDGATWVLLAILAVSASASPGTPVPDARP
ncbi:MAG: hypothetical protein QOG62_2219 [Thermoleophilaceae bacterium]|nr:hypothetical protein [Thermoleophilaceae bacterium]